MIFLKKSKNCVSILFSFFKLFLFFLTAQIYDLNETFRDFHRCTQTCRLVHDLESDLRAWICAPQPTIITSNCLTQTARARRTPILFLHYLLFFSPLFCSCLFSCSFLLFFLYLLFFSISFFFTLAAQVAKTTYDVRGFQAKAFSKMKGFKG